MHRDTEAAWSGDSQSLEDFGGAKPKSSRALLDPKSIQQEQGKVGAIEKAPSSHPAPGDLKQALQTQPYCVRAMLRPWSEAKTELG